VAEPVKTDILCSTCGATATMCEHYGPKLAAEYRALMERVEAAERERDRLAEQVRTTLLADEERRKLTGDALAAEEALRRARYALEAPADAHNHSMMDCPACMERSLQRQAALTALAAAPEREVKAVTSPAAPPERPDDECPRGGLHSWRREVFDDDDDLRSTGRMQCSRCGEWRPLPNHVAAAPEEKPRSASCDKCGHSYSSHQPRCPCGCSWVQPYAREEKP
jgi:hypothetical protein